MGIDDAPSQAAHGAALRWTRRVLWLVGTLALLAVVTITAVVLSASDVFDDPCDRTQLVVPEHCPGAPGLRSS